MSFEHKKSLGQNFLNDKNIIKKISNSINPKEKDLIIEIGPGEGALTKELISKNCDVISFEIDKRLEETLIQIKSDNLKIIYEDFLKVNLNNYINEKYENVYFVGNLPYYITTAIINKITEESSPKEIIIMIQKEVANRFMAKVKTKQYNSLSVFLQYNYNINKICEVSRNCFYPIPKVDSMVIKLTRQDKYKKLCSNEKLLFRIVKDAFRQKRKNLNNNLKSYDKETITKILNKYDKSLYNRAEEITIEEFIDIANNLSS